MFLVFIKAMRALGESKIIFFVAGVKQGNEGLW